MANWIDEHPDRYGSLGTGDHGPFPFDGKIHFVRLGIARQALQDGRTETTIIPDERAACGAEVPDWRADPKAYPICGVVDCEGCLEAMRRDQR
jgi:hypothetical protein